MVMSTFWRNTLRLSVLVVFVAFFSRIPALAQNQDEGVLRVDVNLVMIDATVKTKCFAPEFLDSELSVFMQQLRAQGAAGELGRG